MRRNGGFSFIILLLIVVVLGIVITAGMGKRRGVPGIGEPLQKPAKGGTQISIDGADLKVSFKYSYDIEALVVHRAAYDGFAGGFGGKLAPVDLALAWGKVAEYNDRIDFHWKQSGRWYFWQTKSYEELEAVGGVEGVELCSSNNHIIPADESVRKLVKRIRRGDHIRLKGYLVEIEGRMEDGSPFTWGSSYSRSDTGAHSCELIYVTEAQKL